MRKQSLSSLKVLMLAAALPVLLTACATGSQSGSVYGRGDAQREMVVRFGVVESVREVTIDAGQTGVGAGAGAVVGGIAGSGIGDGRGQMIGTVLGAVAGGVAGQMIEGRSARRAAQEITVRFESGERRAIVQEITPEEKFAPGQTVRILSSNGKVRVAPQ